MTASSFYEIRRAISAEADVATKEIRPVTRIETLLPKKLRRNRWKGIGEHLNARFPDLEYPTWFIAISWLTGLAIFLISFALMSPWINGGWALFSSLVYAVLAIILILGFGTPLRTELCAHFVMWAR